MRSRAVDLWMEDGPTKRSQRFGNCERRPCLKKTLRPKTDEIARMPPHHKRDSGESVDSLAYSTNWSVNVIDLASDGQVGVMSIDVVAPEEIGISGTVSMLIKDDDAKHFYGVQELFNPPRPGEGSGKLPSRLSASWARNRIVVIVRCD